MTIESLAALLGQYGLWLLFVLVAVEYIGIPGYPGGFTLPAIGVLCRAGLVSFWQGFAVALAAGSLMIVLVYLVGLKCGEWLGPKLDGNPKFSKGHAQLRKLIERYGNAGVFVARLIPFVRVFVSITAGLLGMEWKRYCIYSFFGNLVYLTAAMLLGYYATAIFI